MGRAVAALGIAAVFVAGVGLGAGVAGDAREASTGRDPAADGPTTLPDDVALAGALQGFDACEDYLDHVRERALAQVTPYGLHGGMWDFGPHPEALIETGDDRLRTTDDAAAVPTPSAGTTPDGVSGTNVQEEGVDEPDRLKTDGEVVYTTLDGRLRVLDITGDDPRELASVELAGGDGAELLLAGDRLLVTSSGGPVIPFPAESFDVSAIGAPHGGGATTLTALDVSDPSDPVVEERLTLDGATLSSRMVDGVARVVLRTEPGINLPWSHPEARGLRAEREALRENRRLIEESEAADWLPYYIHETARGQESEGLLLDCRQVARPSEFAGLGTLSVLTVDVADGGLVPDAGGVGVLAGGDTVYASTGALYVATRRFIDPAVLAEAARGDERPDAVDDVTTEIHAFDISDPTGTDYLASGEVPGVLLDQWALSEHEGVLRVASTVGDRWWGGGEDSSSLVTTLEVDDDELVELGQVGDLGPTERIYAVRFIGDAGYVVTFRQVDPLYVVDLGDPTRPRVTGELEIPGYSAYLHPLGDDLLVGVGQDADEQTGRALGAQVSLFDVGDPADPRRIDELTIEHADSDVEHDHRAFLHWPATGLTVVPVTRWWHGDEDEVPAGPPNGALAVTADRDGFAPVGPGDADELALTQARGVEAAGETDGDAGAGDAAKRWHEQHDAAIQRTLVVGERLLTFSTRGVVTHDLGDLSRRGGLEL
jgi:hypothetical protein